MACRRALQIGSIIKAVCPCGFKSEDIFAGSGFSNLKTTCIAPAICLKCKKLLIKNYMKKHEKCPGCGQEVTFYNDPSVQAKVSENNKDKDIFSWRISDGGEDFRLPNVQYLCPKCGKKTLTFVLVGTWD